MRDAFERSPQDEKYPFRVIQDQKFMAAAQRILRNGQSLIKQGLCPGNVALDDM